MNASHPFARFAQFRLMCIEYPLVVTHRETSTYIKVPLKSWSDTRQALHAVTDPRAAFLSAEDVQASTWFQRMDRGHGDTELSGKIWGKLLTYDREEIEKLAARVQARDCCEYCKQTIPFHTRNCPCVPPSDADLWRRVVNGWVTLFYDDCFLCQVEDRDDCTAGISTPTYFRREFRNGKAVISHAPRFNLPEAGEVYS